MQMGEHGICEGVWAWVHFGGRNYSCNYFVCVSVIVCVFVSE